MKRTVLTVAICCFAMPALAQSKPAVDAAKVDAAVAAAFAEPDPAHPRNTRALVVVHRGRIVAERYAPDFDKDMPLVGWSVTKGALNALIGMRVKDRKLAVADKDLLPEWRKEGDPRREISLDDLLRMSSGLEFDESYDNPLSDVTEMLFVAGDKVKFAADKPLLHPPGTQWRYSSGTSMIVSTSPAAARKRGRSSVTPMNACTTKRLTITQSGDNDPASRTDDGSMPISSWASRSAASASVSPGSVAPPGRLI